MLPVLLAWGEIAKMLSLFPPIACFFVTGMLHKMASARCSPAALEMGKWLPKQFRHVMFVVPGSKGDLDVVWPGCLVHAPRI